MNKLPIILELAKEADATGAYFFGKWEQFGTEDDKQASIWWTRFSSWLITKYAESLLEGK